MNFGFTQTSGLYRVWFLVGFDYNLLPILIVPARLKLKAIFTNILPMIPFSFHPFVENISVNFAVVGQVNVLYIWRGTDYRVNSWSCANIQ